MFRKNFSAKKINEEGRTSTEPLDPFKYSFYGTSVIGARIAHQLTTPRWDGDDDPDTIDDDTEEHIYKDLNLYEAAKNGSGEEFGRFIDSISSRQKTSFDAILHKRVNERGDSLLHTAVMHGNSDVVTYITSRAVGTPGWLLKKNINGDSALHMAARAGNMLSVAPLLQIEEASSSSARYRDNRVREKNRRGNTPVHEALISGHIPVASYLIQVDPEVLYCLNYKSESPLYMAVEASLTDIVSQILQNMTDDERMNQQFKLKSPVHLAVKKMNRVVLEAMFNGNTTRFFYFKDNKGRTPLHYGAYFGYYEEVRFMLGKYSLGATLRDEHGLCPIHLASIGGHVDIVKLLLLEFIDPNVVCDKSGRNILHHAARNGRYNVVKYILNNPNMEGLLNMKDVRGNIPLHYATVGWHPRIVIALTWDHRVDVKLANHTGMTALDAAEAYIDKRPSFRQRLTWSALKSAGVPRSRPPQTNTLSNNSNVEYFETRVNTLLVVATLLAALAFAAGFTMPGGYSSSEEDLGMAIMLRKRAFQVFVVSDSIAAYFSLVAVLSLVFALLGDLNMMYIAVSFSQPILGTALIMGSVAFTSGAYVVLSGLRWLSILVLVFGSIFTAVLFILAIPLCISFTSRNMISRYLSYFPYCLMMLASGSYKEDELFDELDDEAEKHEDEASVGDDEAERHEDEASVGDDDEAERHED